MPDEPLEPASTQLVVKLPDVAARELLTSGQARVPDRTQRGTGTELAELVIATASSAGPSLLVALEKQAVKVIAAQLWAALKRARRGNRSSLEFKLTWGAGRATLKADVTDPEALEVLTKVLRAVQNDDTAGGPPR